MKFNYSFEHINAWVELASVALSWLQNNFLILQG
jgi:hypothetical protein